MGSFYRALPEIARLIEADYDEASLDKAYQDFQNIELPEEPLPDEHDGRDVYWQNWTLRGRITSFTIHFEKYEMLYGWWIRCPDEETYLRFKEALSGLLRC